MDEGFIGSIFKVESDKEYPLKSLLKKGSIDEELDRESGVVKDVMVLANNQLVVFHNNNFVFYDQNYNVVDRHDSICGVNMVWNGITYNRDDKCFYTTAWRDSHQIHMVDLDFNLIKSITFKGNYGSKCLQGISYKKEKVYVCDTKYRRIDVFDKKLRFLKYLQLNFLPIRLKVSDSIVFVGSNDFINFYHLKNLKFYRKFTLSNYFAFTEINSCFYVHSNLGSIFCFNGKGELNEEIFSNGVNSFFFGRIDNCLLSVDLNKQVNKFLLE